MEGVCWGESCPTPFWGERYPGDMGWFAPPPSPGLQVPLGFRAAPAVVQAVHCAILGALRLELAVCGGLGLPPIFSTYHILIFGSGILITFDQKPGMLVRVMC